jgi:hypothetical protein
VKTSSIAALALATLLAGSLAAYAQTEQPIHHHYHGPHHTVHHHFVAHTPAAAPESATAATISSQQAAPFGLALPHIAPYPDGKGDEDGLSGDENDCNTGCVDGNTPN